MVMSPTRKEERVKIKHLWILLLLVLMAIVNVAGYQSKKAFDQQDDYDTEFTEPPIEEADGPNTASVIW